MPKVVISEFMDESAIAAELADFDTLYDPGLVDRPEALEAVLAGAEALIVRNRTQVHGTLLAAARNLKVVGRLGVGLDNIDVAACRERGIAVYPATGANDGAVAEYVVATAMLLLRGAYGATGAVAAGAWPRNALMGREIGGKRLGLVGFGSIARETARRAAALGMAVAAHDPFVAPGDPAWTPPHGPVPSLDLDALATRSDVLSLHVPLTDRTRGPSRRRGARRVRARAPRRGGRRSVHRRAEPDPDAAHCRRDPGIECARFGRYSAGRAPPPRRRLSGGAPATPLSARSGRWADIRHSQAKNKYF